MLAAEESGIAVALFVLGLAALPLLFFTPPRTAAALRPHNVSPVAFALAIIYVLAALIPAPGPASAVTVPLIQFSCLECLVASAILLAALRIRIPIRKASPLQQAEATTEDGDAVDVIESATRDMPGPPPTAVVTPPAAPGIRPAVEAGYGILVGLAALFPTALLGEIVKIFSPRETMHPYLELLGSNPSALAWIFVAAVLCAPVKEELIYRVVLHGFLKDRFGLWGVIAAAVAFAGAHQWPDSAMLLPLAVLLGALYERRRTVVSVCAAHATFNAANIVMALAIS